MGKGEQKKYSLNGAGFYYNPTWSPDSKMISFTDNGFSIYYIDLSTSKITKIATEPVYDIFGALTTFLVAPIRNGSPIPWSPPTNILRIWSIPSTRTNLSRFTDGLSDCSGPVFDNAGKYLYFLGSTDAGP